MKRNQACRPHQSFNFSNNKYRIDQAAPIRATPRRCRPQRAWPMSIVLGTVKMMIPSMECYIEFLMIWTFCWIVPLNCLQSVSQDAHQLRIPACPHPPPRPRLTQLKSQISKWQPQVRSPYARISKKLLLRSPKWNETIRPEIWGKQGCVPEYYLWGEHAQCKLCWNSFAVRRLE